MSDPRVLPNSRLKNPTNLVFRDGVAWVPIFCANCGADGGLVPLEASDFAFYLCDERVNNCAAKWSPLVNTMLVPDEVFWQKVKEAQLEKYGRELTEPEIIEQLKDGDSILSKLARER